MKKVTIMAKVLLELHTNEDLDIEEALEDLDCEFTDLADGADVIDHQIVDWEVVASR